MTESQDRLMEERLKGLEERATEIRKLLLGTLIIARERWMELLEKDEDGKKILDFLEEAEASFVDSSIEDWLLRFESTLDVIHKRSGGLFALMEYVIKETEMSK